MLRTLGVAVADRVPVSPATALALATLALITLVGGGCREAGDSRPRSAASERDRQQSVPRSAERREEPPAADPAEASGDAPLVDVTPKTGIEFTFTSGRDAGEYAILESLGGGVGSFDYDRDGHVDLMLAGGGTLAGRVVDSRPCGLFRNLGGWSFGAVTAEAGAEADAFYNHGIFPADFDADGFLDVAVTGYGGLQLLRNQGDGTFVRHATLTTHPTHPWSTACAWADYDADGHLDCYVAHYVDWSWDNHPACPGPRGIRARSVRHGRSTGSPTRSISETAEATFVERTTVPGWLTAAKGSERWPAT